MVVALALNLRYLPMGPDRPVRHFNTVSLVGDPACDPVGHPCGALTEALGVRLQLQPPVRPLRAFDAMLALSGPQGAAVDQVQLEFVMDGMEMGSNRYTMVRENEGHWRARVTLPICTTGRTDWWARVRVQSDQTLYRAQFPFQVATHASD